MSAMMKRREFISLLGAAATWPLTAHAQQPNRVRRVGVLSVYDATDPLGQICFAAFQERLRQLGWIDGRNVRIEYRFTGGNSEQARIYVSDFGAAPPDVILAETAPLLISLKRETDTIPIVFVQVVDPVGRGIVPSLARPGGNITGFTHYEPAMGGKWVDLLRQIAPNMRRIGYIFNPEAAARGANSGIFLQSFETFASTFGLEPIQIGIREVSDIEPAIGTFARAPNGGVQVPPDLFNTIHRDKIIASVARNQLPAIYPYRFFTESGGLASYGIVPIDPYIQAASYVDRVLKGEKPGELPIQAPTKFELVINLKTAKALDLTLSPGLLALADEVIE